MPYFGSEETVKDLKRALSNPHVQSDRLRYRNYITKVIRCMSEGLDVSGLFMEMVKAGAVVDVLQKKLVFLYMTTYASVKPDLALLAINTLRKDCDNPNPMVRGLALRSMCNLRMPGILEYVQQPVLLALRDKSSYVHRVAVLACAKIHNLQPSAELIDGAMVNELYALLRDPDPVVMLNCLRALEEILQPEGGVVINKPIAHHLINRLKDLDSWSQSEVLTFLLRYRPHSDDELFDVLSSVDAFLLSAQPPVMAAALRLFLHLAVAHPAVQSDALLRARGPLLAACGATTREMRFTALCHIQQVLRSQPGAYGVHYKRFFCSFSDPAYIKLRKMEILVELVNDENVEQILEELRSYCTDVSPDPAQAAITAIGEIGRTYSQQSLKLLTALLELKQEHITSAVMQVFRDLSWFCPQSSAVICDCLEGCNEIPQDNKGKQAVLWLLGVHGEKMASAPYVLEGFIDGVSGELCPAVRMELLTASLKLFLTRPAETQDMLGRLLHHCIEEERDLCVRDRALLYYRLLQRGVTESRTVLLAPTSDPCMTLITARLEVPVSRWSSSFNTLDPLSGAHSHAGRRPERESEEHTEHTESTESGGVEPGLEENISASREDQSDEIRFPRVGQNLQKQKGESSDGEPLNLTLFPLLSHDAFEKMWVELKVAHRQCLQMTLPSVSPETLSSAFQLVKVQVLACSRGDAQQWKLYVCGRSQSSVLLAELLQGCGDVSELSIKQQPEEPDLIPSFISLILNVLHTLRSS